jgi:hypothetical protein
LNPDAMKIYQTLLSEHHGSAANALLDMCHRYLWAMDGFCAGFKRMGMNDFGADPKIDVPANPITDEWISTGVDA